MENENVKYRNMTISLKVAADEKIMLRRLAEKHSVTLSEFMYNLVMCFKNQYDYIGILTPREEKLAENLRKEKKINNKLIAEIENADFRVQMEMERAAKAINAKDEFAYQLKEQKAINADQLEELKRLKEINRVLKQKNIKLRTISSENQLKNIIVGTAGLFTGLSLKR
jgi:nitrous oxide reductase|tara:strand:+ start:93 stop:599 length:507 start_codon:yes stop_codon:yes gene_type:complete